MAWPDNVDFRPGKLSGPMQKRIDELELTPSQYLRRLIASDCGVPEPEIRRGNKGTLKQYAKSKKKATEKRNRKS